MPLPRLDPSRGFLLQLRCFGRFMLISVLGTGPALAIPLAMIQQEPFYGVVGWGGAGLVLFSLLWSVRAAVVGMAALADAEGNRRTIAAGLSRGLIGSVLGVGVALTAAKYAGANLMGLAAEEAFYVLVMPAIAGFGWTARTADPPGRRFRWIAIGFALLLGVHAVGSAFDEPGSLGCEWHWEPRHEVHSYTGEPWHWKYRNWLTTLVAPGALAELTVLHAVRPLIGLTCPGKG